MIEKIEKINLHAFLSVLIPASYLIFIFVIFVTFVTYVYICYICYICDQEGLFYDDNRDYPLYQYKGNWKRNTLEKLESIGLAMTNSFIENNIKVY